MCGRYSMLTEDEIIEIREVIREWSLRIVRDDFSGSVDTMSLITGIYPAGDVRPTNRAPVIVSHGSGEISFENLRWGFRKLDGKGVIINARSETLTVKGMFNSLLSAGRCVVPAGRYYEWDHSGGKRSGKGQKHFIKDSYGNLLFMAGLYRDSPEKPNGPAVREFVIITKAAYGDLEKIHDRMPVILKAGQVGQWLGGELSPDEISRLDFNLEVTPAEDENPEQLTL